MDMFEPQDHPNDFKYPGAPPTPPYDIAGWTEFDRGGHFSGLEVPDLLAADIRDFFHKLQAP